MSDALIEIRMANTLTEQDMGDICWVLLDPSDPGSPEPQATAALAAPQGIVAAASSPGLPDPTEALPGESAAAIYRMLRAAVLGVTLVLAGWMTQQLVRPEVPSPPPPAALADASAPG